MGVIDLIGAVIGRDFASFPIVECIELMDEKGLLDFEVLDDLELGGVAAQVLRSQGAPKLQVQNSVYEEACDNKSFGRFTLAHELGHFFLHSKQSIPLTREMNPKAGHEAYEDSEWQANTFAAELLVDSRLLRDARILSVEEISKKFFVSKQTAKIQLKHSKCKN